MRSLVVSGLVGLAVLLAPSAAHACSCVGFDSPEKQARFVLENSDGAFIGELRSKRAKGKGFGPRAMVFTYRVEEAFGVGLGERIRIGTTDQTAACGLTGRIGGRYALGFSGRRGDWSSTLCSFMSPKALKAVAGEGAGVSKAPRAGCSAA